MEMERKAVVEFARRIDGTNTMCWYVKCHEPLLAGVAVYCAGHELAYRAATGEHSIDAPSLQALTEWENRREKRL